MFLKIAAVSILLLSTTTEALPSAGPVIARNAPPLSADSSIVTDSASSVVPTSTAPEPSASPEDEYGPLVLVKMLLAQSTTKCQEEGCGCAVLHHTTEGCETDQDVCQDHVTLAAMVCGQCNSNQVSVDMYNRYLKACVNMGMTSPHETITIPLTDSETASAAPPSSSDIPIEAAISTLTTYSPPSDSAQYTPAESSKEEKTSQESSTVLGLLTEMSSETDSPVSSSASSNSTTTSPVLMAYHDGDDSGADEENDVGAAGDSTDIQPQDTTTSDTTPSSSFVTAESPSSTSISSALSTGTEQDIRESSTMTFSTVSMYTISGKDPESGEVIAGVQTESATSPPPEAQPSTAALEASTSFFEYGIDEKCDRQCEDWQDLATSCEDDKCLCVQSGLTSAAECAECLGSTTHGESYPSQVGFYNAYTGNCSAIASTNPTTRPTTSLGYDIVEAGTTSTRSLNTASIDGPTGTKAGAEAVVTVLSGSERGISVATALKHGAAPFALLLCAVLL